MALYHVGDVPIGMNGLPLEQPAQPMLPDELIRRLSQSGAAGTNESCIQMLRGMDLPDSFWMYQFKVVPCAKSFSHKWTLCPCAHAGETARRRDPRTHTYKAVLCPLVKAKKTCPLGDNCMWSHNVFEHWLHPTRYKTRLCSFGPNCNRPICFFAHSAEELRCVPQVEDSTKEVDEREYMMQLLLAQEKGLMPNNMGSPSLSGNVMGVTSSQQLQLSAADVLALSGQLPQVQSQGMITTSNSGPLPVMHSGHMGHYAKAPRATAPVSGIPSMSAADSLLMNLHDQLAGMALGLDGMPSGTASAPLHRLSDPGAAGMMSPQMLASALHPMPHHLNRISESGNALALANPSDLESLLPLMNSLATAATVSHQAAQQQRVAQQQAAAAAAAHQAAAVAVLQAARNSPQGTSPSHSPPPASSSPHAPSSSSSPTSDTGAHSPERSANGSANIDGSTPSQSPQQASVMGGAAAGATYPDINTIMTQLQEQGLANSKEQLVASLTQILAQLLSANS